MDTIPGCLEGLPAKIWIDELVVDDVLALLDFGEHLRVVHLEDGVLWRFCLEFQVGPRKNETLVGS